MRDEVDDDEARACSSSLSSTSHSSHSNPRASRNLAEKQRRDNLNTQIATMASLVPSVSSGSSRKKDKISVLRLSAAHLRMAYTLGTQSNEFLPRQFNGIDLENSLIDTVSGNLGFLLVLTTGGKIIYISRHVEQHLGHEQIDMIGDSLYNYVYADDHEELTIGLTSDNACPAITNADSLEEGSNSSEDSSSRTDYRNFRPQRRNFYIRMSQRTNSRRETVQYEYLLVSGILRLAYECKNQEASGARGRTENSSTSNDIIFVGNARLLMKRRIAELSLLEANKNEYFTRHLVDGRIIFCDHRISIVAGYMSEEVSGTSAFKFMHKDDVRWTIVALRHMYEYGNYGSSCYRLITKTGEFIYLRTHGYLEYDETTQSVTSFICINTLTSKEEGDKLIAEMKKRYSATINNKMVKAIQGDSNIESDSECANLEDATELEDAITQMINDLPSPVRNDDRQSPTPLPDTQLVKAVVYSKQLPPASIQASKIGIKDTWPYPGKGGKDEKRKQESSTKNIVDSPINRNSRNGDRTTLFSEKRMPELDDSLDLESNELAIPTENKVSAFTSMKTESCTKLDEVEYVNEIHEEIKSSEESTSFNVQANLISDYSESDIQFKNNSQHMNLKRSYEYDNDKDRVFKKKTLQNVKPEDIIEVDNCLTCTNEELNYPTYIQVQPEPLDTSLHEVQTNYLETGANTITISNLENHYIDIQELSNDQLLKNTIENNSEILKLFSSLPPTLKLEGDLRDANIHQYPTSDQVAVVENEGRHMHLLMSDSVSSCESQFSDLGVTQIQAQRDNLTQVNNMNTKTQDQGLVTKRPAR